MPPGINGRHGFGPITPPAATPLGGTQAPVTSRPSSPARPDGLASRHAPPQAGMAPRQRMPQGWQPPALGVPAQPHAAAHGATLYKGQGLHLPPGGGASGRGGIMQSVRNIFQQIRQFPQQLQQLAQAATAYRPITVQHALHTAQMSIQSLQSLSQPTPYMHQPMSYGTPHQPAHGTPHQPAHGTPVHQAPPPVWGVPVAPMLAQPATWHHPAQPPAMHPAVQVQHSAQQFMAQAQAFDASMVSHQAQQMHLNARTVQNCMAELQQMFLANQALLAGAARPGQATAHAMM